MNRITQIQPGDTLIIVCEENSLSRECDRLRAELVAAHARIDEVEAHNLDLYVELEAMKAKHEAEQCP